METIAKQATEVFCALMDGMNGKSHLKILNDPFMPLVIERIAEKIKFGLHTASLYSLSHYYEFDGDLMADPEMCFIVADNRRQAGDYELTFIVPYMYHQASAMIYEESIVIDSHIVPDKYIPPMQHKHAHFANQWLINIQQQGFLIQLEKGKTIRLSDDDE